MAHHKHLTQEDEDALTLLVGSDDQKNNAFAYLTDEIRALRGKLAWAWKRLEPLKMVEGQIVSSLQAKLHEHKLAYVGLRKLQTDTFTELAIYKAALQKLAATEPYAIEALAAGERYRKGLK